MPLNLVIALVATPILAIALIPLIRRSVRQEKARRSAFEQSVAKRGIRVDFTVKKPPPQPFDLFEDGIELTKQVIAHFWREGEPDSVLQYQFTRLMARDKDPRYHTVAMVKLPFSAPHTKIGAEDSWTEAGQLLGVRDIETESTKFNDRYRVTSDDERFAITLLDQDMLAWFLSDPSADPVRAEIVGPGARWPEPANASTAIFGAPVTFEIWGTWMLCITKRLSDESALRFLDWSQEVRDRLPAVLSSLYPIQVRP